MRKELEDKLAKLFSVPTDSPSYDELFVFLEDAESELAFVKLNLQDMTENRDSAMRSLHAAWDVLNYIEDLEEDIMSPTIDPAEKRSLLESLFARVKGC